MTNPRSTTKKATQRTSVPKKKRSIFETDGNIRHQAETRVKILEDNNKKVESLSIHLNNRLKQLGTDDPEVLETIKRIQDVFNQSTDHVQEALRIDTEFLESTRIYTAILAEHYANKNRYSKTEDNPIYDMHTLQ